MARAATRVPNPFPAAAVRHHHCRRRPTAAAARRETTVAAACAHAKRERDTEAHRSAPGKPRAREMEEDGGVGFLGSLPASERKLERRVLRQNFGIRTRDIYQNHLYRRLS